MTNTELFDIAADSATANVSPRIARKVADCLRGKTKDEIADWATDMALRMAHSDHRGIRTAHGDERAVAICGGKVFGVVLAAMQVQG